MSMSALCASRVSCTRIGIARALICWSLPFPEGYSTTVTSVIVPPSTVSRTCTGPQRVLAEVPVTVAADAELLRPAAADPEVVPEAAGADSELVTPVPDCDDVDVW